MVKFKNLIAIVVMSIASTMSFAATIDTSGLTESQINELKISALKLQQAKDTVPEALITSAAKASSVTLGEAEKWADFGKNLGVALVSTARELGVAINDFSKTDLGKITTFIIVYKIVGASILNFIAGLILMIMLPTLIIFARRYVMTRDIKFEYQDRKFLNYFPYKKKVITQITHLDSDDSFWVFLWSTGFIIVSILFSLFIMFRG